jgi:thiol-disulfide isomerase/thioredoxin
MAIANGARLERRTVLAGGGSLAALVLARKPAASEDAGRSFSDMVPTNPKRPLPPILFTDADGTPHSLNQFVGRGVLLNLWATWCAPCIAEMPALDRLAAALGGDVAVLPLSSDRGGAPVVEKFFHAHDINSLAVWLDPRGEATQALNLRGIPTTLIIDREGLEVGRIEGAVDWLAADTAVAIKSLIA